MTKKILIVEDEKDFHDIYTGIFKGKDYDIVLAYDGEEALEKLTQIKPDLIVTDIQMSIVTGDTFFLYLKSMPEYLDIPVIIISSCSQEDYRSFKEIDPDTTYIEKSHLTGGKLLDEVNKMLAAQIKSPTKMP